VTGSSFVHLHNHTSYSLLDGASKIDELVDAAVADNQPSLAISDHGNLYGLIDFYRSCKERDVNPVLGIESYFCDDQAERGKKGSGDSELDGTDKRYYHLTVLAENNVGYQNLMKLSSDAFMEGFYYKPRTSWDKLAQFSEGLIVTSGCLGGPVLQELLHDRFDQGLAKAARLQEIFGKNNFFIELQDHGLVEQKRTNPQLIEISRRLGAPVVAANDSHYVHHDDHVMHDSLLCLQTGARIADEKRFRFKSDQHYLKSAEEMRYLFREIPEACDNTLLIGERANVTIDFDTLHLPVYTPPEGYATPIEYLTALASKGLQKRYGDALRDEHYERLSYELGVIDALGLASYFLIVWDLIRFADREGIRRGPARGSVAGCLVAYCMNISKVDPIRHNLIFERFLNPSRIAMPDIDLDFDTRYRDKLINYTFDKYGSDRVAQIITFSYIKARSAVRDAGRILGYEPAIGNKISKAMPGLVMGESTPLAACFNPNPRYEIGYNNAAGLRQMYAADPNVKEIVDVALGLEGLIRQDGVHAAAVVIAPGPLTEHVPVQRKPDPDSPTGYGPVVTQYEKNTIEDLGLLKMDYLGLRNLDVISECINLIGYDPGIESTDFDDEKTFELLRKGNTVGVFQLESKPMRNLLIRMQPTSIDDIAAVVALYRPGPMASNMHYDYADRKAGRQMIEYFHEDAKDILDSTLGLMVYQEQVMQIAQRFAGYTMVEADGLRKIIGKKLIDKMAAEREKFVGKCLTRNYSEELAVSLFGMIEAFAAYAFNASHAYGYAYISYQTAFLKANFPQEYMTALCSSVASKIEKSAVFLSEARKMGIEVYTPDINRSDVFFSSREEGIRVGLAAVKNIGPEFSDKILSERRERPFESLIDFVERVNPNAGQVESLALSGAFDAWGTRLGISSVSSDVLSLARKAKKKVIDGQTSMFDTNDLWEFSIPDTEFPQRMKMEKEREAIGIFVSGHPVESYEQTDYRLNDLESFHEGEQIDVFCLIDKVIPKVTRAGPEMAILTLSDETGVYDEIPCFPKVWARLRPVEGDMGVVSLRVGVNYEGERTYILNDFKRLNVDQEDVSMAKMRIYLPQGFSNDDAAISKLKGVLLSHYGNDNILLQVSKSTVLQLPDDIRVSVTDDLINDLRVLFRDFSSR
jgi:DNA polymerase-3 subunit alpha